MLNEKKFPFRDEFNISLGPVIAILLGLSVMLIPLADMQMDTIFRRRILIIVVAFYGMALVSWGLSTLKPWVGKSFFIIALLGIIHIGLIWQLGPGFLIFLTLPIMLTMTLIHVYLAIGLAAFETILLLSATSLIAPGESNVTIFITLLVVWLIIGSIYYLYRSVGRISEWSWNYYQQALSKQEETREQKEQMGQLVEDLAQTNLQLKRLNILAQDLRQVAEDARATKEQFVANVSHELRTPLNMIIGFSEMILKNPGIYRSKIPPTLLADLTVINRNAEHLACLIDDVLDLSQIEADKMALTKEPVNFIEIIDAVVIAVRPLFETKNLFLKTQVPDDTPMLYCDRTRIREVLLNLLSNAGRFTEEGGVCIQAEEEGNFLTVSVADTGRGIAPGDLGKLFQPFQQLDGSIRRHYGGTGLGLNISKRFVELHDGKMWVESQVGKGTIFYFQLPLAMPQISEASAHRWFTPGWDFIQRTRPSMVPDMPVRPRYLVLEQGNSLQRMLLRYMGSAEIIPVKSLEQASTKLAESPYRALLINHMAVGETLDTIQNSDILHGTPAIICDLPGTCETTGTSNIVDYLIKPVTSEMLYAAIDRSNLAKGKTILIVDNEPELLRLFRRMLLANDREYRVLSAVDGGQALEILHEEKVDLLMLDLVMPNVDGFTLLATKEQDADIRDIPAIVISARDPIGQPIISHALALTLPGGISVPHLLACIENLSQIISETGRSGDPLRLRTSPDSPVSE